MFEYTAFTSLVGIKILLPGFMLFASAALLYLASNHQTLVQQALPQRTLAISGFISLLIALILIIQMAGSATSVFIIMTVLMFVWSIFPPIIAYLKTKKGPL